MSQDPASKYRKVFYTFQMLLPRARPIRNASGRCPKEIPGIFPDAWRSSEDRAIDGDFQPALLPM